MFCRSLFVLVSFGHCVVSVLLITNSDYPFGIFKLFLRYKMGATCGRGTFYISGAHVFTPIFMESVLVIFSRSCSRWLFVIVFFYILATCLSFYIDHILIYYAFSLFHILWTGKHFEIYILSNYHYNENLFEIIISPINANTNKFILKI